MCDLKADEHKSNNILIYAKRVDSDIKMKCQNLELKNQRADMEMVKAERKDETIKERVMMGRGEQLIHA